MSNPADFPPNLKQRWCLLDAAIHFFFMFICFALIWSEGLAADAFAICPTGGSRTPVSPSPINNQLHRLISHCSLTSHRNTQLCLFVSTRSSMFLSLFIRLCLSHSSSGSAEAVMKCFPSHHYSTQRSATGNYYGCHLRTSQKPSPPSPQPLIMCVPAIQFVPVWCIWVFFPCVCVCVSVCMYACVLQARQCKLISV